MSSLKIGVFARAPEPGRAKTRLIPLLGAEGAASLQRELTRCTLQTACRVAPGAVTLFTDGGPEHPFWTECRQEFSVVCQRQAGRDLGERMQHALNSMLSDGAVVLLIGTDCPVLGESQLQQAAALLRQVRMAFIPAEDGGYVLVGARELCPAVFENVAWGSADVMRQTHERLDAARWEFRRDWDELPPLWDIDRPEDYLRATASGGPGVRPSRFICRLPVRSSAPGHR